ncbi:hypothetical protein J3D56_004223 [Erwinia persicina]|uniref:hypothetical protein n=1 Tax=Erwinia persicina TaxID=55211 RepID=UPI00209D466A|nr:hypothetical protein [Erwinia persicina]MCP1440787.1 hypothetical protein [Erwinia persicina]
MSDIFDTAYAHRIAKGLKDKIVNDIDGSGFISRGILEAIRLLENESIAQSTKAMLHKERKLKGLLSDYWHIHVSEDHLTRTYNNIGNNNPTPIKNPSPDEVIEQSVRSVFLRYLKSNNIPYTDGDNDHLTAAIKSSAKSQKEGFDKTLSSLREQINPLIQKLFFSNNKNSGDWLIYWKNDEGENYYLEHSVHIDANDESMQKEMKELLDERLLSLK